MDKKCLNCRFYRLEDILSGRCRVDRRAIGAARLPLMKNDDCCPRWVDCGQQYYIRLGWIRGTEKKRADTARKAQ